MESRGKAVRQQAPVRFEKIFPRPARQRRAPAKYETAPFETRTTQSPLAEVRPLNFHAAGGSCGVPRASRVSCPKKGPAAYAFYC